mgnify:FL=1
MFKMNEFKNHQPLILKIHVDYFCFVPLQTNFHSVMMCFTHYSHAFWLALCVNPVNKKSSATELYHDDSLASLHSDNSCMS